MKKYINPEEEIYVVFNKASTIMSLINKHNFSLSIGSLIWFKENKSFPNTDAKDPLYSLLVPANRVITKVRTTIDPQEAISGEALLKVFEEEKESTETDAEKLDRALGEVKEVLEKYKSKLDLVGLLKNEAIGIELV